jgi:rod shape determining protein RodA
MISSLDRKVKFDWILFISVCILIIVGTLSIYSSTSMLPFRERIIRTHFIAIIIGFFSMFFMWILDYQILDEYSGRIYFFSLLLLLLVLFFGVIDKGSRSWFRLPFFSIQPSEIARLGLIIYVASYISRNPNSVSDIEGIIKLFIQISPFFILMIKQPDFSGVLITFFPLFVILFVAGINMVYIYIILAYIFLSGIIPFVNVLFYINPDLMNISIFELIYNISFWGYSSLITLLIIWIGGFVLWYFINKLNPLIKWIYLVVILSIISLSYISGVFIKNQIKDYQYKRIVSFINPYSDPRGAGYNIIQARIALGSGGIGGRGIFSGTQSRLGFVPERHTDFIFSVVGEEMGIIGSFLVIGAYLVILNRIKTIIFLSRSSFGYYLCCSFAGLFMGYFFINIGMILGFFPVAGVPLPFVSYGGSNLVSSFMIVGILNSIYARRLAIG